jgi:cytochrome b6-f complex iron-sulfur subunit
MTSSRRSLLARAFAGAGLALSYGLLGGYFVAYLFPARHAASRRRLFVGRREQFARGAAHPFVDQRGRTLLILARSDGELVGFDSTCPHLGCHVHWEAERDSFVCPCHQGFFDADGVATAGPPAAAGQSLARVTLEVDERGGTVFLQES